MATSTALEDAQETITPGDLIKEVLIYITTCDDEDEETDD